MADLSIVKTLVHGVCKLSRSTRTHKNDAVVSRLFQDFARQGIFNSFTGTNTSARQKISGGRLDNGDGPEIIWNDRIGSDSLDIFDRRFAFSELLHEQVVLIFTIPDVAAECVSVVNLTD